MNSILFCMALVGMLATFLAPGVLVFGKDPSIHKRKIFLGMQSVQIEEACVIAFGFMSSGEFFEGLQRIKAKTRPQFRKGLRLVEYYPDELLVEIHASVKRCYTYEPEPQLIKEVMETLTFKVFWKRGLEMRPGELKWIAKSQGAIPVDARNGEELKNVWSYEFPVAAKGVPLSDHLIVTVYRENGEAFIRFSGRL